MSNKAAHWLAEIPPGLLKDSDFRVLFHLCDAHNSLRSPETACFPSQSALRMVTGLSNGGLNNSLNRLEASGLVRRRRTRSPDGTKGVTYYILGCDGFEAEPSPKFGVGENPAETAEDNRDAVVDKSGSSQLQTAPSISTVECPPSPHRSPSHLHERGDKPVKEPGNNLARARAPAGGRERARLGDAADDRSVIEFRAATILKGQSFLCTSISAVKARECIELGLVSESDCRAVGIAV